MNMKKMLLVSSVLAASTGLSSMAQAEAPLTANIGFTSNYIWRGVTQSSDDSAISGGIDYAHDSGFYVGTWTSSLGGGSQYELDLYAGYGFNAGPVALDAGYITYQYPVGTAQLDFDEIYLNASWEWLSGGIAYTVGKEGSPPNKNDMYLYVAGSWEVAKGLTLGATYGDYDFDDPTATDYSHIKLDLSKDDFVFAIEDNDQSGAAGDTRLTVSYSKAFDLL